MTIELHEKIRRLADVARHDPSGRAVVSAETLEALARDAESLEQHLGDALHQRNVALVEAIASVRMRLEYGELDGAESDCALLHVDTIMSPEPKVMSAEYEDDGGFIHKVSDIVEFNKKRLRTAGADIDGVTEWAVSEACDDLLAQQTMRDGEADHD